MPGSRRGDEPGDRDRRERTRKIERQQRHPADWPACERGEPREHGRFVRVAERVLRAEPVPVLQDVERARADTVLVVEKVRQAGQPDGEQYRAEGREPHEHPDFGNGHASAAFDPRRRLCDARGEHAV